MPRGRRWVADTTPLTQAASQPGPGTVAFPTEEAPMRRAQTNAPTLKLITDTTAGRRQAGIDGSPIVNLTIQADDRLLLTVVEAARRLEVSRSLLYELIAAGEIESIHVGRLRRIPADALSDYVDRRRDEGPEPAA